MYKVLCDGALMCDSRIEELALINPVVTLEENKAGSFSFTIPPEHPMYDAVTKRKSLVQVFRDDEMVFSGICTEEKKDFYKQKTVYCEGELTFFNDSVQRPAKYQGITVRGLLEAYIAAHNAQVEEAKRFTVGQVTVTDPNDYIYCFTNMESTMQALKEDLVDDLGGFFRIRHEDGVRYLDYLAESPNTNSQVIKLGKNLMDFTTNIDSSDIATAIIPLGAKLEESPVEGLEVRLTIESVNDGLDYVHSEDAVAAYGWIYKTVEWNDVTTAEALKRKGEQYLTDIQFENMVIKAKAVDLHLTDGEIEQFKISDQIRVVSAPHGLNRHFRLTKQIMNLNNPEKDTITLGKDEKLSLSAKSNQASEEIKKAISEIVPADHILKNAISNATKLINQSMTGYITTVMNEDGSPKELLIMDTPDINTATKVWRWNVNGLGYSSKGYEGDYALAMTMDGKVVASSVVALDDEGDFFKVADGYAMFGNDGVVYGGIGYGKSYGYNATAIKAFGDLIIFTDDNLGFYYINPNHRAVTSDNYTENHIFRGTGRFTGMLNTIALLASEYIQSPEIIVQGGGKLYGTTYDDAKAIVADCGFYANGSMGCSGTKYRVVETENHGKVGMNAFETAEAYFADIGSAEIGADGSVKIAFESIFAETIEAEAGYQVFLTRTSHEQAEWVEKQDGYFVVHGEPGATFDWMLCCKQKGYADVRMSPVNIEEQKKEGANDE